MSMSSAKENGVDAFGGLRPTKACVNCRRQKMRCEMDDGPACRRCKASKTECIFRPRANAAAPRDSFKSPAATTRASWTEPEKDAVFARLEALEALLAGSKLPSLAGDSPQESDVDEDEPAFRGVWKAAKVLQNMVQQTQNPKIWEKATVKTLWLSFHTNTPALHFLSQKRTSSAPTPLLLAAILYVATLHHSSSAMAALAPEYFVAFCSAIAQLCGYPALTTQVKKDADDDAERVAFENVLGILLASLISEGIVETTGIWISIGYRLALDHCPIRVDKMSREWGGIFSGLQIIDLEHASLHLSCPIVPIEAPLASLSELQSTSDDPFYPLTRMMHAGLSRFTGRGLPSIWSFVTSSDAKNRVSNCAFTDDDAKVIREWAGRLDQWLVQYNKPSNPVNDNIVIFRQYALQRLFVLSIYLPARGFDLFANNVASVERHELLLSARAVVKLHTHDKEIWSNWDLVLITWAALLVLQAIEGGAAESEDFSNIQSHLNLLQGTHQPEPSLRHILARRLESVLQGMHTPPAAPEDTAMPESDPTWHIFDENSIKVASERLFSREKQPEPAPVRTESSQQVPAAPGAAPQFYEGYLPMDGQDGQLNLDPNTAWSSTLMRVFGNNEFPPEDDAVMAAQSYGYFEVPRTATR